MEKVTTRQNRVREALERIYDKHPPHFADYLKTLREDPKSRVFAPLAEAYRRLGRLDEAIAICQQGLSHHPDFYGGRIALAKCFMDKKRFEDAKKELQRVVQSCPENLLAQRLLGDVFVNLHDSKEALHCYRMALLLAPQDVTLNEKVYALEKSVREGGALPSKALMEDLVSDDGVQEAVSKVSDEPSVSETVTVQPVASSQPPAANETEAWKESPFEFMEEDEDRLPPNDPQTESKINAILGFGPDEDDDDSFRIEAVASALSETGAGNREITTETLGDLYFSQGQFDKSLRIFEKIQKGRPTPHIAEKILRCQRQLGVDRTSLLRAKQVKLLEGILEAVRQRSSV